MSTHEGKHWSDLTLRYDKNTQSCWEGLGLQRANTSREGFGNAKAFSVRIINETFLWTGHLNMKLSLGTLRRISYSVKIIDVKRDAADLGRQTQDYTTRGAAIKRSGRVVVCASATYDCFANEMHPKQLRAARAESEGSSWGSLPRHGASRLGWPKGGHGIWSSGSMNERLTLTVHLHAPKNSVSHDHFLFVGEHGHHHFRLDGHNLHDVPSFPHHRVQVPRSAGQGTTCVIFPLEHASMQEVA